MPFHFCWNEAQLLLFGVPFVGYGWVWLRSKLRRRTSAHNHQDRCC